MDNAYTNILFIYLIGACINDAMNIRAMNFTQLDCTVKSIWISTGRDREEARILVYLTMLSTIQAIRYRTIEWLRDTALKIMWMWWWPISKIITRNISVMISSDRSQVSTKNFRIRIRIANRPMMISGDIMPGFCVTVFV
jgi:hypothetical protein